MTTALLAVGCYTQSELDEHKETYEALAIGKDNQIAAANAAISALEDQLEDALEAHATDVEMYEGIIADAEAQIAGLDADNAAQASLIAELNVVIEDANAAIALLEAENAELEATIEELQSRLNAALTELRNRPTITVTQFVDVVREVVRNVPVLVEGTFTQADIDAALAAAAGGSSDGFSTIADAIAAVAVGGDLDALNTLLESLRGNEGALDTLIGEVQAAIDAIPVFDPNTASYVPAIGSQIADFVQTLTDENGLTGGTRNIVVTLDSSEYSYGGGTGADAFNRRSGLSLEQAVEGGTALLSATVPSITVFVKHTYSYSEGTSTFVSQPAAAQVLTFVPPTNTVTDTTSSGTATDTTSGGGQTGTTTPVADPADVPGAWSYSYVGGSDANWAAGEIDLAGNTLIEFISGVRTRVWAINGERDASTPSDLNASNQEVENKQIRNTSYVTPVDPADTLSAWSYTSGLNEAAWIAGEFNFGASAGASVLAERTRTVVVNGDEDATPPAGALSEEKDIRNTYVAPVTGTVTINAFAADSGFGFTGAAYTALSVAGPNGAVSLNGQSFDFDGAGTYTITFGITGGTRLTVDLVIDDADDAGSYNISGPAASISITKG